MALLIATSVIREVVGKRSYGGTESAERGPSTFRHCTEPVRILRSTAVQFLIPGTWWVDVDFEGVHSDLFSAF